MLEPVIHPKIEQLIADELFGLDDFEKLAKLSELIEVFSREVPAALARMRIDHLRRVSECYTGEEIKTNTGMSQNRIRKLMDR
jgi:hypothetical protein